MPKPEISLLDQLRALRANRDLMHPTSSHQIAQLRGDKLVELFFQSRDDAELRAELEKLMHSMRIELNDNLEIQNKNIQKNKDELQANIDENNDLVWNEFKRRMGEYLTDKGRFVDTMVASTDKVVTRLDLLTETLANKDFCCTNGSLSTNGLFTFFVDEDGMLCCMESGLLEVEFTINDAGILEGEIYA